MFFIIVIAIFISLPVCMTQEICDCEDEDKIEINSSFDSNLLKFRWNLLKLEIDARNSFDMKYLDFLNQYNETMNGYFLKYTKLKEDWKEICEKFPIINADQRSKNQIFTLCDDILTFIEKSDKIASESYENFYLDDLSITTIIEGQTEDFFHDVNDKLEFMNLIEIYHMNSTCVIPFFDEFLKILNEHYVNKISSLFYNIRNILPSMLRPIALAVINNFDICKNVKNKINQCITAQNITDCLSVVMSMCHKNNGGKTRCDVYHSIKKVYDSFHGSRRLESYYQQQMEKILIIIKEINEPILEWQTKIEECLRV
ncbi:hypothetical protein PVAND_008380 [Polypedilum vanderplanki]|uniref:Secreted protein n=1 Tax=Polypedilum vanderplanki TaxID=319348 RepID=A0A9J6C9A8_POLVA|nr:hypothetical protein PVAND_008380 [Polypedilum vanderplanki]